MWAGLITDGTWSGVSLPSRVPAEVCARGGKVLAEGDGATQRGAHAEAQRVRAAGSTRSQAGHRCRNGVTVVRRNLWSGATCREGAEVERTLGGRWTP